MPGARAKRKQVKQEPIKPSPCILCKLDYDDEMRFGKLIQQKGVTVHHFCVLFACGLAQNARTPKEGIEGFLVEDIHNEVKRAQRLRCSFCKRTGATIGCYVKRCQKMFHLYCGQENGTLNQFFNEFRSFCKTHKPKQTIAKGKMLSSLQCGICYGDIECVNPETHVRTPCCASGWFHRICIQQYAVTAGYFFKCPLCNNKDLFRDEMLEYGIYIPDKDAAWESEQNAYHELLERPECGASECLCPEGRRTQNNRMWRMVYCEDCGSTARHIRCEKLSRHASRWKCPECVTVIKKLKNNITNSPTIVDLNVTLSDNPVPTTSPNLFLSEQHVEPTAETDFVDIEADVEPLSITTDELSANSEETLNILVDDDDNNNSIETNGAKFHTEFECKKDLQNSTLLEDESIEIMREDDCSNIETASNSKQCDEIDTCKGVEGYMRSKSENEHMQVEESITSVSENIVYPPNETVKESSSSDGNTVSGDRMALDCDTDYHNAEVTAENTISNAACSSELHYSEETSLVATSSCSTPVPTIINLKDELVKETVDVHDTEKSEIDVQSVESPCSTKQISQGPLCTETRSYLKLGNLSESSASTKKSGQSEFKSKGFCQTPITKYLIHSSFTSEDITMAFVSNRPKAKPLRKRRNGSNECSRSRPKKEEKIRCFKLRKIDNVLRLRN